MSKKIKNSTLLFQPSNVSASKPQIFFAVLFSTILISLCSCSYEQDKLGSSNQSRKMAEQNAQIAANFNRIAGSYSGILKTVSGDEQVQINLTTLAVSEGSKNPDGSARIHTILSASYLKIKPLGQPLINFSIAFIPETGELTLINEDEKTKNDLDEVNTIFARVTENRMTGTVKSAMNELGVLELIRTNNNDSSSSNGAKEEYNDRLRQQYAEIAGSYMGCVLTTDGGSLKKSYTARMVLSLYEDTTNPQNQIPALAGNFHRDSDRTDGTDTALSATYRSDLTPATLTILGRPYISNNGYISTFKGTYIDGDFSGTFTSNKKGLEGLMLMSKGSLYPRQCLQALVDVLSSKEITQSTNYKD
jgi:hypothetical protein